MNQNSFLRFPTGFFWGTATSAYQIEGAWDTDGRGMSIWDTFSRTPKKVHNGHTGDEADDHYNRWQEDVQIMSSMHQNAYRFSIAWPRVQPTGVGAPNQAGLDFYDRLVDGLLANHIQPFVTLYHWDLPQTLQDTGGWTARDTVYRFADFARLVVERLGDRVTKWITINEPFVAAMIGHFTGRHAPGLTDPAAAFSAAHYLLLAHGLSVPVIRSAARQPVDVGITLNLTSVHPASGAEQDRSAARRFDGIQNRLFLDPVFCGAYPNDLMEDFGIFLPKYPTDDMGIISADLDFLGINYYNRTVIRYAPEVPLLKFQDIQPLGNEYTLLWEIYPPGLYEILTRVWNDYHPLKIFVTENGCAMPDGVDADGRVRDLRRTRFLRDHLVQCHRAIDSGVPLKGYFAWSLLDNFEWAYGYDMRFGLVFVDYTSQKRIVKDSGYWYAQTASQNGFDLLQGAPYYAR